MSRSEIIEFQQKRFRAIVHYAWNNSAFYQSAFSRAHLKPTDIERIDDLQRLKFFATKDDLRSNYPYGMLAVPREQVAMMHATSGTSGTPAIAMHTKHDLENWAEISARSLTMSGLTRKDVFQITPSFGMFSGGFGFYHGARKVGCTILPASAGFSKRQIQFMRDFGTTMFSAIVSYAFRLAEVAKEMGLDPAKDTNARKGIFGSEVWTKELRRKLSKIWDMEPFDIYGFTELCGPGVGNDCRVHDGLHIWEDFFIVEVVDPRTGESLGTEEEGELVFTTLNSQAMPLIRYRSRDISTLIDSRSCDCGRTHRRYKEITGRSDDMLKVSGVNFWPSEVESVLLKESAIGQEYKIDLYKDNLGERVAISVESLEKIANQRERETLARRLTNDLRNTLLFSPDVVIVDPNTLPRVDLGKTKRVYDTRN
jgi:phenylacetate-CoA ligase